VNLTPPEIYRRTGIALVARAYSHNEHYHPRHDIAEGDRSWFAAGFFPVTDIRALPASDILTRRRDRLPFRMSARALKAFPKKGAGNFDHEAYLALVKRYNTPIGQLPPFIRTSGNPHTPHCH
jgi:hypothetical protein